MTYYIFYCMDARLSEKKLKFKSDEADIALGIAYEADVWKLTKNEYTCIYSPYEGRIAPSYLKQTSSSTINENKGL